MITRLFTRFVGSFRPRSFALTAVVIAAVANATSADACGFSGTWETYQETYNSAPFYWGVGGYIYSTDGTISNYNVEHEAYWYGLTDYSASTNMWVQLGRVIGHAEYTTSTPQIYTENGNGYLYPSSPNAVGHLFGAPPSANYRYFVWWNGGVDTSKSPQEYQFSFAVGPSATVIDYGYMSDAQGLAQADSELLQNSTTSCNDVDAYFGTNNGTAASGFESLVLQQNASAWHNWDATIATYIPPTQHPTATDTYYWDVLNAYTAAHGHGS